MQTTTFPQRGKIFTQRLVIKTGMMVLLLSALLVITVSGPVAAHPQQSMVYTQSQDIGTPRIDVFARGSDNTLLHRWGRYTFSLGPWESLGYRLASAPSVVRDPLNPSLLAIAFQYNGDANILFYNPFTGYKTLQNLGHYHNDFECIPLIPISCAPTEDHPDTSTPALSNNRGHLEIYYYDATHEEVQHRWIQDDNTWSDWESLSTIYAADDPVAITPSPGRFEVFMHVVSDGNGIQEKIYDKGNWQNWQSLGGGPVTSSPSVAIADDGTSQTYMMVARNAKGGIQQILRGSDGQWTYWVDIDNSMVITGSPALVNENPTNWDLFARGPDDNLWVKQNINRYWVAWNPSSSAGLKITSSPAAISWTPPA